MWIVLLCFEGKGNSQYRVSGVKYDEMTYNDDRIYMIATTKETIDDRYGKARKVDEHLLYIKGQEGNKTETNPTIGYIPINSAKSPRQMSLRGELPTSSNTDKEARRIRYCTSQITSWHSSNDVSGTSAVCGKSCPSIGTFRLTQLRPPSVTQIKNKQLFS